MIKVTLLMHSCLSVFSSCLMRTQFKQKAPRLEAHVVSHWFKQQYVVTTRAVLWQSQSCSVDYPLYCWAHCMLFVMLCFTTMSCFAIKSSKVQVQDLRDHYVQLLLRLESCDSWAENKSSYPFHCGIQTYGQMLVSSDLRRATS